MPRKFNRFAAAIVAIGFAIPATSALAQDTGVRNIAPGTQNIVPGNVGPGNIAPPPPGYTPLPGQPIVIVPNPGYGVIVGGIIGGIVGGIIHRPH